MYSEAVLEHFHQPAGVGRLENYDGRARCSNPVCGDEVELWLALEAGKVAEFAFQASGCVATVASLSCLCGLVKGATLERAMTLTKEDLLDQLGGLPRNKSHGAALAISTLRAALKEAGVE
ncbi:MAG: iron-sulfur cluster assembly scaffold protein [Vulcanimicrobiota bacterium]